MKPFSSLRREHFSVISSTQLYAAALIKQGKTPPGLVVADAQTDGRGRSGKSFFSPAHTGMYLTYSFPSHSIPCEDITPRAALSVREAIRSLWGIFCGVKWVNDLYWNGGKVCGILTQRIGDYILIGIGVNLAEPPLVPESLTGKIGWLFDAMPENRDLLPEFIYQAMNRYFSFSKKETLSQYRAACFHIGKCVAVENDHQVIEGECVGIDDDFRLCLMTAEGERYFDSGFVSLKINNATETG